MEPFGIPRNLASSRISAALAFPFSGIARTETFNQTAPSAPVVIVEDDWFGGNTVQWASIIGVTVVFVLVGAVAAKNRLLGDSTQSNEEECAEGSIDSSSPV